MCDIITPGVAGHAGADEGVEHGDGEVTVVEDAVHPLVWEDVGGVGDGRA